MNRTDDEKIKWLEFVYRLLDLSEEVRAEGNELRLRLVPDTGLAEEINLMEDASDGALELQRVPRAGQARKKATAGDTCELVLYTQHEYTSGLVYRDLDHLLSIHENLATEPSIYLIHEPAFRSWVEAGEIPEEIEQYRRVLEFAELVRSVAHYSPDNRYDLFSIFVLKTGPQRVSLRFSADDLRPLDGLTQLVKELSSTSEWSETRRSILANSISDLFNTLGDNPSLPGLLGRFPALVHSYRRNMELFEASFKFETQKERLEADKRELVFTLSSIVTDAFNKLLAIPGSLLLIGSQLDRSGSSDALWPNLAIFLASFGVTVLVFFLTSYQRGMLKQAEEEMESRKARWIEEAPHLVSDEQNVFQQVDSQVRKVRRASWTFLAMAIFVQVLAIWLFFQATPAAQAWVREVLELLTAHQ